MRKLTSEAGLKKLLQNSCSWAAGVDEKRSMLVKKATVARSERVWEVQTGASRFSIVRMAAISIRVSEVCTLNS